MLDLTLPADSLLPGVVPAQEARCLAVGEPGHVGTGLGDHHISGQGADPRDSADQVAEPLKGLDHHLDPVGQGLDRCGMAVDQVKMHPGQEGVMLAEPSGQRLGQFRDLRAQPPLGQIGQGGGVAVAGDQ